MSRLSEIQNQKVSSSAGNGHVHAAPGSRLVGRPWTTSPAAVYRQFERWAEQTPDATAVMRGELALTYAELNDRANAVARELRALGVGREVLVGLCLERSVAMAVGALAILKAGGAFLPISPAEPEKRLGFMLDDAGVSVLVTERALEEKEFSVKRSVVALDDSGQLVTAPSRVRAEVWDSEKRDAAPSTPESLAYVIYTSGSTGVPKGVEITHDNLTNLVSWHCAAFEVTARDRASFVARVGFDAGVWEIWPYLAAGASLHIADDETLKDEEAFQRWLIEQGITIGFVPTPLAERLLSRPWPRDVALRVMLTGGDTLHLHPSANLPFQLVNNYGPTECTVVATSGVVLPERSLNLQPSIGRPIANTEIYILDEQSLRGATPAFPERSISAAPESRVAIEIGRN